MQPELAAVRETFERWLYLPDPGALFAGLAAAAAHRIPGDPAWLMTVGPSGGGKTELLNALAGLDDVHAAATLTEAALLSGTAKNETAKDAKGGLLRSIGSSGIIVCKDFGSILSMNRDARALVLAALREVYDGSWTRHVGTDGGRTLHWEGKVTLVAGCTPAIDQHHAVLASLGERFVMYRLTVDDANEQARRSLAHAGREKTMRAELRAAVSGLLDSIDLNGAHELTANDTDRLIALAVLVVRCRSAVIRDTYSSRDIELVPDAEAPGRLVGVLERMLAGLRVIGLDNTEAWQVVTKIGLDSMPTLRRRALEYLINRADDQHKTSAVGAALALPTSTTLRVLEDLAAHNVIARYSGGGQGKADHWQIAAWTVAQYTAATGPSATCCTVDEGSEQALPTSPETSEEEVSIDPDHTYDDISGEVGALLKRLTP